MRQSAFSLKYGSGTLPVEIPESNIIGVISPREVTGAANERAEIEAALASPIASPPLAALVKPSDRVVIAVSDVTRPTPTATMLPPLLAELNAAGVGDDQITVVFGLGIHRHHTRAEQEQLVGSEIFKRLECIDSDPEDCVDLGTTSRGTPVRIFRRVAQSDFRIGTGNVEYHYFAGYSGGAKAFIPGVSDRATIQHNHSMLTQPGATAGRLDDNPVRQDIEEAGEILGVGFVLNTVLNSKREIVKAVAGSQRQTVRAGASWVDEVYGVPIDGPADIVVASAGGYPKDIDLYQTQKAIDHAHFAVRPGGIILLAADCPDGFGEPTFEQWMREASCPADPIQRIKAEFVLGGHKAAMLTMAMQHARVFLVSALPDDLARSIFFTPVESLQAGLEQALSELGHHARVIVMPNAGSTLPRPRWTE